MRFIDLCVKKIGAQSFVTPKLMSFDHEKFAAPLQGDGSSATSNTLIRYSGVHPFEEFVVAEGFEQIHTMIDPSTANIYPQDKVVSGVTAAGTTQAAATALTAYYNIVSTVTTTGDGVKLPAAAADLVCVVHNAGANACKVWPATGDAIGTGAVNIGDTTNIASGEKVHYWAKDATTWYRVTPITK